MSRIGLLSAAALAAVAVAAPAFAAPGPIGNTALATSLGVSFSASLSNSPVSVQVLSAEVSNMGDGEGADGTGDANLTGAGNSNAQFSGVQTASQNTGQQAASNAATGAAASAAVTFGAVGGNGQNNH